MMPAQVQKLSKYFAAWLNTVQGLLEACAPIPQFFSELALSSKHLAWPRLHGLKITKTYFTAACSQAMVADRSPNALQNPVVL